MEQTPSDIDHDNEMDPIGNNKTLNMRHFGGSSYMTLFYDPCSNDTIPLHIYSNEHTYYRTLSPHPPDVTSLTVVKIINLIQNHNNMILTIAAIEFNLNWDGKSQTMDVVLSQQSDRYIVDIDISGLLR